MAAPKRPAQDDASAPQAKRQSLTMGDMWRQLEEMRDYIKADQARTDALRRDIHGMNARTDALARDIHGMNACTDALARDIQMNARTDALARDIHGSMRDTTK